MPLKIPTDASAQLQDAFRQIELRLQAEARARASLEVGLRRLQALGIASVEPAGAFKPSDIAESLVPGADGVYDAGLAALRFRSINAVAFRGICIAAFAFSSGQDNGATTGSDVAFDSYDVTIPADLLAQPGDMLVIDATWRGLATAAATRTGKVQLGSTGKQTVLSTSTSLANMIMAMQAKLRRRTSTTGALTGETLLDWSSASPSTHDTYPFNVGVSGCDWTTEQTLHFYGQSTVASTIGLTDMNVWFVPVVSGVTV